MEIPEEILQAAKEQDEPLWKVASEALSVHLGMDEVSSEATHKRRLSKLRNERERLAQEIEELQEDLHNTEERIEYHEEQLHKIQSEKDSYEERLMQVLREMDATDKRIMAFRSSIRELAVDQHGRPTPDNRQKVIDDLRSHAADCEDLNISRMQWQDGMKSQQTAAADGGEDDVPAALRKLAQRGEGDAEEVYDD
jgi:chromosome segregation ATPase